MNLKLFIVCFNILILINIFGESFGYSASYKAYTLNPTTPHSYFNSGISYERYAKAKLSELYSLKNYFEKNGNEINNKNPEGKEALGYSGKFESNKVAETDYGTFNKFLHAWSSIRSIFSEKKKRNDLICKLIPNNNVLKKMAKIRKKMNPETLEYLVHRYNSLLTSLMPFSSSLGVPSHIINSMKIDQKFNYIWSYVENLLDNSNVKDFIENLPEFKSFTIGKRRRRSVSKYLPHYPTHSPTTSKNEYLAKNNRRNKKRENFFSDQESGGMNIRRQRRERERRKYRGINPLNIFNNILKKKDEWDKTGLYGPDYTENYGKDFDDYNLGPKGESRKKFADNLYSSSGYGGSGYDYGHSGHGLGIGSYLDPFAILGGLAFLVYLGLLFQQTMNMNSMTLGGGREEDREGLERNKILNSIDFIPLKRKSNQLISQGGDKGKERGEKEKKIENNINLKKEDDRKNSIKLLLNNRFSARRKEKDLNF